MSLDVASWRPELRESGLGSGQTKCLTGKYCIVLLTQPLPDIANSFHCIVELLLFFEIDQRFGVRPPTSDLIATF